MTKNFIHEITEEHQEKSPNIANSLDHITRVEDRDYYSLSSAQERLWIIENLADNGIQYNIADAYIIYGTLNTNLLQQSINHVIARHESLRTAIRVIAGVPKQFILDSVVNRLDIIDLSSSKDKYQEARSAIQEDTVSPFNLQKAPLLRLKLFKINDLEHILYFNFHHIICDGWSIDVFFSEVFHFYSQKSLNKNSNLEELSLRYRDYVNWKFGIQKSDKFKKSENYWIKTLQGDLPKLNLKNDFERQKDKNYSGSSYRFKIEPSLSSALKMLGRRNETTLFTILMAVYNVVLSYNSSQQDIIIGFPVSGRDNPNLGSLIGMFVDTVVVRSNCDDNIIFQAFLEQVKNNITQALEHQHYPFENIVKVLGQGRDPSRHPIFDAVLAPQNFGGLAVETSMLNYKGFDIQTDIAWVDIALNYAEVDGSIEFKIIFDDNLFAIETIRQLAQDFIYFSQLIVEQPNLKVAAIKSLYRN